MPLGLKVMPRAFLNKSIDASEDTVSTPHLWTHRIKMMFCIYRHAFHYHHVSVIPSIKKHLPTTYYVPVYARHWDTKSDRWQCLLSRNLKCSCGTLKLCLVFLIFLFLVTWMVSHCDLICIFLVTNEAEHLLMCLLASHIFSLVKFIHIFVHFFNNFMKVQSIYNKLNILSV